MAYIKSDERHGACFLCAAAEAPTDSDEELYIVARGSHAFVIMNRYPYNTGHLMVAPKRHIADLDDLEHEEFDEIWMWTRRSVDALRSASAPQGFNIGINLGAAAGAGVPDHVHLHVVPRWSGDTNFMPVVADVKVLPEMLAEAYARLRPLLNQPS